MPITYHISIEAVSEIESVRKTVKDKQVDKRLHAIQLRAQGMKNPEIAEKLDCNPKVVSRWVCAYHKGGLASLLGKPRGGNHRNLSYEQEAEFLAQFEKRGQSGQILTVEEIKQAYIELVGHSIGGSQIYRVLHRHGWRKVMPRSQHPQKADEATIEASKKLNLNTVN